MGKFKLGMIMPDVIINPLSIRSLHMIDVNIDVSPV